MNIHLKNSVEVLRENKYHYDRVDTYAREMFSVWCDRNPKQSGTWRGYKNFEILDETNIRVNFEHGAGDMEFDGHIFVDLNTNEITETR